jgi:hypothetical protein
VTGRVIMTTSQDPDNNIFQKSNARGQCRHNRREMKSMNRRTIHGIIRLQGLLAVAVAPAITLVYRNGGSLCIAECMTGSFTGAAILGKNTVLRRLKRILL